MVPDPNPVGGDSKKLFGSAAATGIPVWVWIVVGLVVVFVLVVFIVGGFILVKKYGKRDRNPENIEMGGKVAFLFINSHSFYWSLPHSWPLFPGHSAWAVKVKCPSLLVTPLNS